MLREEILQDFINGVYSKLYKIHDEFSIYTREFSVDLSIHVRHDDIYGLIPKYASSKVFYMDDVIVDATSFIEATIKVREKGEEFEDHVRIAVFKPSCYKDGEVYARVVINDKVFFRISREELKHLVVPILNSDLRDFVEVLDSYSKFPIWPKDIEVIWEKGCEGWVKERKDDVVCRELIDNRDVEGSEELVIALIEDANSVTRTYYVIDISKMDNGLRANIYNANNYARTIKTKPN